MEWISANWYNILTTILWVVFGFLVTYFKEKTKLVEHAKYAINSAEKQYELYTKAGGEKFKYACSILASITPTFLKPFITQALIEQIVQSAFNGMEAYAKKQLDKVVDKVIE